MDWHTCVLACVWPVVLNLAPFAAWFIIASAYLEAEAVKLYQLTDRERQLRQSVVHQVQVLRE